MFNIWSFQHLDAIISSGLGGGSLIYANVLLEKEPRWFTQPVPGKDGLHETWSFSYENLALSYKAVKTVLDAQTIPPELAEAGSPKTREFLDASEGHGEYAQLAVRFLDREGVPAISAPLADSSYGSIFGNPRRTTCRMLGVRIISPRSCQTPSTRRRAPELSAPSTR